MDYAEQLDHDGWVVLYGGDEEAASAAMDETAKYRGQELTYLLPPDQVREIAGER